MKLTPMLRSDLTWMIDGVASCDELLVALATRIAAAVDELDAPTLLTALRQREAKCSTATPEGVAFPHAMLEGLSGSYVAAVRLRRPVPFNKPQGTGADVVFVLVGPPDAPWEHIRTLARLARICHGSDALARLRAAPDERALFEQLVAEDERHV